RARLMDMLKSGELITHTWTSLKRLFWGTIIGGVPALVLGIVMGLNRPIRAIFDPLIAATYPIPKSSILPLALLIFGLGEASKIFMVAIAVFFPVAINATTGVLEIHRIYLHSRRNYPAGRCRTFRTIGSPYCHADPRHARARHRACADRDRRDARRQKRDRFPDLERVADVCGRADVRRAVHDRAHRICASRRAQPAGARHHPVEDLLTW